MANSNSFLSLYEILPLAQENKYLGKFFLFYHEIVCCVYSLESPHRGDSNEYTQHTIIVKERKKNPKLLLFASYPGTMINPQWLELPMSRTIFYGPNDVRAIEVRLYSAVYEDTPIFGVLFVLCFQRQPSRSLFI